MLSSWGRGQDTVVLAGIWNEISGPHQAFLGGGGLGITVGDGRLTYGAEQILEVYYYFQILKSLHAAIDYQCANHLAYNRDRGPVNLLAARLHWEF